MRWPRSYKTGGEEPVWNSAISLECCPVREYPAKSNRCPGVVSSHVSLTRGMVGTRDCVRRAIRVRIVPSPPEDNRLSWSDRQAVWHASYDSELEHDNCGRANFEESHARTSRFSLLKSGDFTNYLENGSPAKLLVKWRFFAKPQTQCSSASTL